MDILAISKDRTRYLVVELKRGRVSDAVVGQIQRYMGYVQDACSSPDRASKESSSSRAGGRPANQAGLVDDEEHPVHEVPVEFHLDEAE